VIRYRAIPDESRFEAELQSNLHPIHARASGIYGFIEATVSPEGHIDTASPHRAQLALWVEDIDSGHELRDVEMLRRLGAKAHPTIEWAVTRVWPRGDGRYRSRSLVMARGRSRSIDSDFIISVNGQRMVVEGEHVFDMRDFGIVPPRFFWLWMEPQMTVRVRVVARQVTVAADRPPA